MTNARAISHVEGGLRTNNYSIRRDPVFDSRLAVERVVNDIRQQLGSSPHRPLRDLDVDCIDGVVTLDGRVPSFYVKQLAQEVARRVQGVDRVVNQLVVVE